MMSIHEHTLFLRDAERLSRPPAFNVMVKPVGSLCNMDCAYCYYLDKSRLHGGRNYMMDDLILDRIIRDTINSNAAEEITFEWHGGEPLLAGIDFFRKVVSLQSRYADGRRINNSIQTNGTLLTPRWADFLRENDFLVGISIDGPEYVHDRFRRDKGGRSSFYRVMSGLTCLHVAGVRFNTMTAVSSASEGLGAEVYRFLKSIGSHHMQFMPVLEYLRPADESGGLRIASPFETDTRRAPWSVSSEGFGKFMCDIFDQWVRTDVGEYFVGLFDATLANLCGVPSGICAYGEVCGCNPVVECNGDVYPCDHFVYERNVIGNVASSSLKDMVEAGTQMWFGMAKRNTLPPQCLRCEFLALCHGECPKHRFDADTQGYPGLNSLCRGYEMFFRHTEPYFREMKRLLELSLPPSLIMGLEEQK